MVLEELDKKIDQDIDTAISFIHKHMKHGGYQKVAAQIAQERKIKHSSAYQIIMNVKARKQQDNEVLMLLLKTARDSSLEISRFVEKHLQ
jgi:hypothetical protein